jgi:hypothetical protein
MLKMKLKQEGKRIVIKGKTKEPNHPDSPDYHYPEIKRPADTPSYQKTPSGRMSLTALIKIFEERNERNERRY